MTNSQRARVGFTRGEDRRQNIYHAMDRVREDLVAKIRPQVMVKPNFLSSTNQLASSHVDAARGVLDFLSSVPNPPREVIFAEGANEKYSGESFDNFQYRRLAQEYDFDLYFMDLHQETAWEEATIVLADRSETTVKMPKTVIDCPCTISLAVAKTHDVCVVTLALKNLIMGTLYKPDRIKMHGFHSHAERTLPTEAQVLNINLIRVARYLTPDIAVIDGTEGLQGNGPGGTDAVNFRVAAAGADVYATDAVMAQAMGFAPLDLGILAYGHELGLGIADLDHIDVREIPIVEAMQHFTPHEAMDKQLQWQVDTSLRTYLTT